MDAYHALHDPIQSVDRQRFPIRMTNRLQQVLRYPVLSHDLIVQSGVTIDKTIYLTIGGGIGSFIWADNLLIHGANPKHIMSIGMEQKPYGRYRRLCRQSQIADGDRLRSDSGSTPDNIWGYPGYAVREAVRNTSRLQVTSASKHLKQIFGEPILNQVYTPVAGRVYASMEREAQRIGWNNMHRLGRVHAIRMTDKGQYAVFYTQRTRTGYAEKCAIAQYVHVAVGYPAVRMLPELLQYRRSTGDYRHVVNAYEKHNHVYEYLAAEGGLAIVRGRGIVASRVLERLCELHRVNPNVHILHLHRRPIVDGSVYRGKQRQVEDHVEIQPYNFPKAAWGGVYREQFLNATDEERGELLDIWGGTTTADRRDWQDLLQQGKREGWYTTLFGTVTDISRTDDNLVCLAAQLPTQNTAFIKANYLIDATGLDADWQKSNFIKDMVEMYSLELNVKNRLHVSESFEIEKMQIGRGHIYAVGAMTLGSGFAPVDSFLGLQYAAQCTVNHMIGHKAPSLQNLQLLRSVNQWSRWLRGVNP